MFAEQLEAASDAELLARIADEACEQSFAIIFCRYRFLVYSHALKWIKSSQAAEELTQDTFVKLWLVRKKLPEINNISAYILRIVTNKTFDYLRSEGSLARLKAEIKDCELLSGWEESAENVFMFKENHRIISEAINKLPANKQKIYNMSVMEAKTPNEIAKEMNLTPSTVRSHLSDAIKYVRTRLHQFFVFFLF